MSQNETKPGDGIRRIPQMGMSQKRKIGGVVKTIILFLMAALWLVPILWLLVTAFSAYPGMSRTRFFPEKWTLANFNRLFFHPDSILQYGRWFMNTLIIAFFTCIISSIFVLMVSYALSCMRFPGRQGIIRFSMILGMFPGALSMVAIYFIMKSIGLTNSHVGMVVVYSAGAGLGYLIVKGFQLNFDFQRNFRHQIQFLNFLVQSRQLMLHFHQLH